jgi:hypothetical protein
MSFPSDLDQAEKKFARMSRAIMPLSESVVKCSDVVSKGISMLGTCQGMYDRGMAFIASFNYLINNSLNQMMVKATN